MRLSLRRPLLVSFVGWLMACGGAVHDETGSSGTPSPMEDAAPTDDAGGTPTDDAAPSEDTAPPLPSDHGAPSDKYPAFPPDMPELVHNGGMVLKDPVVVTVTFPGEPNADKYEAFGDRIGTTEYWKAIVSEYGVGPASSGPTNHIRMTEELGPTFTNTQLRTWVRDHIRAHATNGWPVPNDQQIYVIYIPPSTNFMLDGSEICSSGVGGYHESVNVDGQQIAYALLPPCSFGGPLIDTTTHSASHEIAEAATDPWPNSDPGWTGLDNNHAAWEFFMRYLTENADMCEVYLDNTYRTTEEGFDFNVTRSWSNASAKAGHNPCVPAAEGPYFNAVTLNPESIVLDLSAMGAGRTFRTKGFQIPVGETKTFQVGFISDAEQKEPWTLEVREGNVYTPATTKRLEVSIDKTSGVNGEKANVTVKVLSKGRGNFNYFAIVSKIRSKKRYTPIMISSP
jgi:hypothetical protein